MDFKRTISAGDDKDSSSETYYREMNISLIIFGLLINISILVRIKYGVDVITHFTYKPYIVTLFLLILMLAQELCDEITVILTGKQVWIEDDFLKDHKFLHAILYIVALNKKILFLALIGIRSLENQSLTAFVCFQRKYRLETL